MAGGGPLRGRRGEHPGEGSETHLRALKRPVASSWLHSKIYALLMRFAHQRDMVHLLSANHLAPD